MKILLSIALLLSTTAFATPSDDNLQIEVFSMEWKGHQYLLFYSAYVPETSNWIHDPECKKCLTRVRKTEAG